MPRFVPKRVEIEAVQYLGTPESERDLLHLAPHKIQFRSNGDCYLDAPKVGWIKLIPGMWVIRSPLKPSQFYPMPHEQFVVRYERSSGIVLV